MATYNPRAGMPPRKKHDLKYRHKKVSKTVTVENVQFAPKGLPPVLMHEIAPPMIPAAMDANMLLGWLQGYLGAIGDQIPDLAQWRRIREEVGRSVVVNPETEEDRHQKRMKFEMEMLQAAKDIESNKTTVLPDPTWVGVDWGSAPSYAVGIGSDGQLYQIDGQGNRKNLCGND